MNPTEYPSFASVWFNLFDTDTFYFKKSSEYTRFLYIIGIIADNYDVHISDIFNSTFYDSYFGNIAHGTIQKIVNTQTFLGNPETNFEFNTRIYPLIHFIFKIVNLGYVDLFQKNYYDSIPYSDCINYLNTDIFAYRVLAKVLNPYRTNVIVVCQSFIRRWLAIKFIRKQKFRNMLDEILYSPPGQIGSLQFPTFQGGCGYISSMNNFRFNSVQQLVDICVIPNSSTSEKALRLPSY
jgi:hypothetical protein